MVSERMCTLTYRLTAQGYQVFFNRDEQRTRPQAIQPQFDSRLHSAYPVDPTGGGTWIAVHETGVTLALLNYYQAQVDPSQKTFISRGVIIPHLLADIDNVHQQLLDMDLTQFQAFQLCVFDKNLSKNTVESAFAQQYIWDGKSLTFSTLSIETSLPITSSSVDYDLVYAARKGKFQSMIEQSQSTTSDYINYHQEQGEIGKCSVRMFREDAKTVSFTQISVNQTLEIGNKVQVNYIDYLLPEEQQNFSINL